MGGTVKLKSELGKGTTFSITQVLKVKSSNIASSGMFQQSEAFNESLEQESFSMESSSSYVIEEESLRLGSNYALVVNDEHFILVCIREIMKENLFAI